MSFVYILGLTVVVSACKDYLCSVKILCTYIMEFIIETTRITDWLAIIISSP